MTKFPPIPRLSIVIPVGRDVATFENTLVSVLENQPADSEILVCHDGRYANPFELSDEVRFVTSESNRFVDLVDAGAFAAQGQFVHILADGMRATQGWTAGAIEKFEHFDAGVVSPVIRSGDDNIILAAGWHDTADRLCKPADFGKMDVPASKAKLIGAYLQASFWRRELLRTVCEACDLQDELDASYAYEWLARTAGWRCVLADQSSVIADDDEIPGEQPSLSRGKRLRAIRGCFRGGGSSAAYKASAFAMLANLFRPSMLGESIGQAFAASLETKISRMIHPDEVLACGDDADTVIHSLPNTGFTETRRAA
ncbi:glycosyltransferase family A protein [Rubripirellula lacrimiformis]|uniref:glycosyltransferase family A protein n=1 Tax=Rubripirellula lacrimiformis TaxID=1930273 RepID=UPI0011A4642B|nr:glycosyltransferase family A protein [Rubripirellula lacrimiformis]